MSKLYSVYTAKCGAFNKSHFSIKKFTEHFKDSNYSLFKRKKDMCNTCMVYEEGIITEAEFIYHQDLKTLALKEYDKEKADNTTEMVVTADTEALLAAPHNDSGLMFFHSKLNLHNFTFYDLHTKDVQNFLWSEFNREIKASNFTTCYIQYLTKVLEENPSLRNITLWSDGCGYQNKCNVLVSALLMFAVEQNVTLTHKYLEVGHTHMECDRTCPLIILT